MVSWNKNYKEPITRGSYFPIFPRHCDGCQRTFWLEKGSWKRYAWSDLLVKYLNDYFCKACTAIGRGK